MSALPPQKKAKCELSDSSSAAKQLEFGGVCYTADCCQKCKGVQPLYDVPRHPRFNRLCKACIEDMHRKEPGPEPPAADWTGSTYVIVETEDKPRSFRVPNWEITPTLLRNVIKWANTLMERDMNLCYETMDRWKKAGYELSDRVRLVKGAPVLYWTCE